MSPRICFICRTKIPDDQGCWRDDDGRYCCNGCKVVTPQVPREKA